MREAMGQLVGEYQAPPWRPEIIERVKKDLPVLRQLVEDIEWIESTQAAEDMTEEQRYYADHLLSVKARELDYAPWRLRYMFSPAGTEGVLVERPDGRFGIEGTSIYFTCGSACEIYVPYRDWDEAGENMTWIYTGIEAKDGKYYFTSRRDMPMAGVRARIKRD
ncbi:DUF5348 domain-containing protein [Anaeroselena agilis]|uniref:DUF5348 domain-containing protein n=1 Tax=Anaeroselena agilis TaxID=3063788 RepID=A0ABU3NTD8_9FIRM|nr:DUF5348 domain-containing protein [Selenomonadales bacterium 4137-cl]